MLLGVNRTKKQVLREGRGRTAYLDWNLSDALGRVGVAHDSSSPARVRNFLDWLEGSHLLATRETPQQTKTIGIW